MTNCRENLGSWFFSRLLVKVEEKRNDYRKGSQELILNTSCLSTPALHRKNPCIKNIKAQFYHHHYDHYRLTVIECIYVAGIILSILHTLPSLFLMINDGVFTPLLVSFVTAILWLSVLCSQKYRKIEFKFKINCQLLSSIPRAAGRMGSYSLQNCERRKNKPCLKIIKKILDEDSSTSFGDSFWQ